MYMSRISPRDEAKQGSCTRKQLFLFGEKMSCLGQDLYLHMYSTCTLCRHPHPHTHTHPLSGSTTMSLGLSRPRYTTTLLRAPSRAELSIRSLSGSVQYSLLCSQSTASPIGVPRLVSMTTVWSLPWEKGQHVHVYKTKGCGLRLHVHEYMLEAHQTRQGNTTPTETYIDVSQYVHVRSQVQ